MHIPYNTRFIVVLFYFFPNMTAVHLFLRTNFRMLVTISTKLTLQQSEKTFFFIDIQTFQNWINFRRFLNIPQLYTFFNME